jgi:hypothetical protein
MGCQFRELELGFSSGGLPGNRFPVGRFSYLNHGMSEEEAHFLIKEIQPTISNVI